MDLIDEFQGWERHSTGKLSILLVFLHKRRRQVFFLKLQASEPPAEVEHQFFLQKQRDVNTF